MEPSSLPLLPPQHSSRNTSSRVKYFVVDINLVLTAGLLVIYMYVEFEVLPTLRDFVIMEKRGELMGGVVNATILRDILPSISFVFISRFTEAYAGSFAMITISTLAYISGLFILCTSTPASQDFVVYAGIFFLALGKGGQKHLEFFFEYQLQEKMKAKEESEVELGSTQNKKDQDRVGEIPKHIWLVVLSFISGIIIIVHNALSHDGDYKKRFLVVAIIMILMYVLFSIRYYGWYSRKELAAESNEGMINRIRKAFCWKNATSMVKEEREMKSFVPIIIWLGFTFLPYSLLLASGNIFFVVQARLLTPYFTESIGKDISILLFIKSVGKLMSKCTCMGLSFVFGRFRKFKDFDARSKRKAGTITKTCCGMVCAVICSLMAMLVVLIIQPHKTVDLVPQFFLLGITEGLVGEGFANLLHDHVPTWMRSFEDSISELMIGTGKIIVLIICILFKDAVNPSHLGRFYLVLAILNAAFLLVYACISIKYAYKEECQQDEEATVEKTLELQVHQPDSEDSYQENNSGTQPVGQEEERLKHEVPESAHMVTRNKGNGRKGNGVPGVRKTVQMKRNGNKMNCFFCKKVGHMKKDCLKYKKWLKKKGLSKPVKSSRK